MLRPRIIVSLLIEGGRLVKTVQFRNPRYIGDPLNAVRIFNEKACDELAFFDIGVSKNKSDINFELLEKIASVSNMPLCYGGGISEANTAKEIVNTGFEKISLSSAFIDNPRLVTDIATQIGSQSVVITIDYKSNKNMFGTKYFATKASGQIELRRSPIELAQLACELGAGEIIFNSISKEGTQSGYDYEFAKSIKSSLSVPVTFLGGCKETEDIGD